MTRYMTHNHKASTPKKRRSQTVQNLTETEQDLLWHMEHGWQLEAHSFGSTLQLRKGKEIRRPASANRNTLKALGERGLIVPAKGDDPLASVWRLRSDR